MPAAIVTTENQAFDALWGWVAALFPADVQANIFKGFQNVTSTPPAGYIVVSPGVKQRQDQGTRDYDAGRKIALVGRHTTYAYQVDCYGRNGPDWADIIAIAWRSLWGCDALAGAAIVPLYADEPQQLNIVNGEMQYEQRFMLRLFAQVNQVVELPQDFFTGPMPIEILPPADVLPPL